MPGLYLFEDGDVQLGADNATPAILYRDLAISSTTWPVEFNPWVWPEIDAGAELATDRPGLIGPGEFARARRIEFEVQLVAKTTADVRLRLKQITDACRPSQQIQELGFMLHGHKYFMRGRFRGCSVVNPEMAGRRRLRIRVRFEATDPAIYNADPTTVTLTVKSLTPQPRPLVSPPSTSGGQFITLSGGGAFPSLWEVTLTSTTAASTPLSPTIAASFPLDNLYTFESDRFFGLGNQASFPMTANVPLVISSVSETVTNGGTLVGQAITLGSTWELLPVSTTNIVVYSHGSFAGAPGEPTSTANLTATLRYWGGNWAVRL